MPSGYCATSWGLLQAGARSSCPNEVNFESLFWPTEELFVVPSLEVFLQGGGGVHVYAVSSRNPCHEQVLLVRNAAFLVIDDLVVSIEGESVLHVPANAKDGDR